jgi:hypothetical protein
VVSLRRSRESEAKDGRFDGIRCDAVEVGPYYTSFIVIFSFRPQGHSSLLIFAINRTIGMLWEISLSHPLGFRPSFC